MSYHYKECGLDNVYLENGFNKLTSPYGESVSIEDTDGLHRAIGQWIISGPAPINGAELRFLRIEMELTQRHLAGILNSEEQTLRLWEKNRKKGIPGSADRLLRLLYSEFIGGDGPIRGLLERLVNLDQMARESACMRETESGWALGDCIAA